MCKSSLKIKQYIICVVLFCLIVIESAIWNFILPYLLLLCNRFELKRRTQLKTAHTHFFQDGKSSVSIFACSYSINIFVYVNSKAFAKMSIFEIRSDGLSTRFFCVFLSFDSFLHMQQTNMWNNGDKSEFGDTVGWFSFWTKYTCPNRGLN